MCFVQTPEMLRLIAGEQPGQFYESRLHWQRKFVDRHLAHNNLGGGSLSIRKAAELRT